MSSSRGKRTLYEYHKVKRPEGNIGWKYGLVDYDSSCNDIFAASFIDESSILFFGKGGGNAQLQQLKL